MHSLVFVILPPAVLDRRDAVARVLAGEARDYETHDIPCSCVGRIALSEAWRQVDGSAEGIQWLRDMALARGRDDAAAEREILRERYTRFLSLKQAHPQFARADADCEVCEGRGVNTVSRNPAEHHDWWVIGGRWDGLLRSQLGPNVARVEDVSTDVCPAAVVTAEGDWYEGPATMPTNAEFREPADIPEEEHVSLASWKDAVAVLLDRYRDHLVVAVDCHL